MVSRVDAFPAELQKIEDRLWSQLDPILVTHQKQLSARQNLASLFTVLRLPSRVQSIGPGVGIPRSRFVAWVRGIVGKSAFGTKMTGQGPVLLEGLRRFWQEPAPAADKGAAKPTQIPAEQVEPAQKALQGT